MGKVILGSKQKMLCIPGNLTIIVPGAIKTLHGATCLIVHTFYSNLPSGLIVNRCMAHLKAKSVPVTLVNTNSKNIWIRQLLLATKLFEVEFHSREYDVSLTR